VSSCKSFKIKWGGMEGPEKKLGAYFGTGFDKKPAVGLVWGGGGVVDDEGGNSGTKDLPRQFHLKTAIFTAEN